MLPELDAMKPLAEPFEMFELADGEARALTVEAWDLGKAQINPRDGRPAKIIRILRVHVPHAEKPTLPHWWDITSAHLIAGLLPHLEAAAGKPRHFRVTKHGREARARFTLETMPAA